MALLFKDFDAQPISLWELALEKEVMEVPIQVSKVVVCETGTLVIGNNPDLWGSEIKYWIPEQRSNHQKLSEHLETEVMEKRNTSIPSIWFKATDKKGRDTEFYTDNKIKVSPEFSQSFAGNFVYKLT